MKKFLKNTPLLLIPAAVAIVTLAWLGFRQKTPAVTPGTKGNPASHSQRVASQSAGNRQPGDSGAGSGNATTADSARTAKMQEAAHQRTIQMLSTKIQEVLKRFKAGKVSPDEARAMLEQLGQALQDAGGRAAGAAIVAFLSSGDDAVTSLEFRVGEKGVLEEAPTLRTAMLDKLGQMSDKDAIEYSRKIFQEARNADEWAVNMRNLAWNNEDKRFTAELGSRLEQMLDRNDWLQTPSAGFLEAFDFAVYLGGREQVANMASVLGLGLQNGLDHAAFLSLDRMTLREPDTVFSYLKQDATLMSWSPDVRAALMARATGSGSGAQRETVEAYMQNPQTTAEEFHQFAELFPLRSYTLGSRLVTPEEQVPGLKEVAQSDLNALQLVRQWLADPRLAMRHSELGGVERRLVEYQKQIEAAKREESSK